MSSGLKLVEIREHSDWAYIQDYVLDLILESPVGDQIIVKIKNDYLCWRVEHWSSR